MDEPFLRIPPFPHQRAAPLSVVSDRPDLSPPGDLIESLRSNRVGGRFWGSRGALPKGRDVVVCLSDPRLVPEVMAIVRDEELLDRVVTLGGGGHAAAISPLPADRDPWDLCDQAGLVITDAQSEVALVAALTGTALRLCGDGPYRALAEPGALGEVVRDRLCRGVAYTDPFSRAPLSASDAIAMLGRWRRLIDGNRCVAAIYGVASWKRVTMDALLWNGGDRVPYRRSVEEHIDPADGTLALAWVSRTPPAGLAQLAHRGVRVGEIEDGMIRSIGLGANCVPPLSIVVDADGPHFDPGQPSELERILQHAPIGPELMARGSALRSKLVSAGIGKYEAGVNQPTPDVTQTRGRRVLVVGQVEDDRSVQLGGAGLTNRELLSRARQMEPSAHIVFRPHPDVEAGHRKGRVPDTIALTLADGVDRTGSMAAQLDRVDAVHVITSLAGFEALLRGREVITHGVPFYAGWELTRDLGPVPVRRTRRLTIDELVVAALILYPRYLDPLTRLPCEAEVVVDRIIAGDAMIRSPLVRLREWQGLIKDVGRRVWRARAAA